MFVRVESNVTVEFPKPGVVVGGVSCDAVRTAPRVWAAAVEVMRERIERATMTGIRRMMSSWRGITSQKQEYSNSSLGLVTVIDTDGSAVSFTNNGQFNKTNSSLFIVKPQFKQQRHGRLHHGRRAGPGRR